MRFVRNLRLSWRALGAQRLRTTLCIGGTAVGIAGVLVLAAIGEGARRRVLQQIDSLGRNMLVVTAPPVNARTRLIREAPSLRPALVLADAEALRGASRAVVRVAPANDGDFDARYGNRRVRVTALATTPEWQLIRDFALVEGRFFTAAEDEARERVVVLGAEPRGLLFPDSVNPLGRHILIGDVPFLVIGVLEAKGLSASGTSTEDDKVLIPFSTARERLLGTEAVKALYVELTDRGADGAAERDVADVLRSLRDAERRGGPELRIDGQRELMDSRLAAQAPLRRMLVTLGVLSLAVAAVGVMATMLLSVRERQREIGLRVAVGARRRDLAVQFLVESLALAITGGVMGVLLGSAASGGISAATRWNLTLSPATVVLAAGSTVLIGVASGLLPAMRAARMDPIESLRAE